MIKTDLHVHSKHSAKPANWLAKQFNIPESFTEPRHIYEAARRRGMTHVTITDHNSIDGCRELMGLPNTFLSCEITARFPEDQCKIHVLAYDISEEQYAELMAVRRNIYEILDYIWKNSIWHGVAHPFYSVNNKLTRWHFERLLVLFDVFELNGFRSRDVNERLRAILAELSGERLEELAEKHGVQNARVIPERKHVISGSDDHSGLFIARSYTTNPGQSVEDYFLNPDANEVTVKSSEPIHLAYTIYSTIYQHIETKVDINKYVPKDDGLRNISSLLTMRRPPNGPAFSSIAKWIAARRTVEKSDAESVFRNAFKRVSESTKDLSTENVAHRWFDTISSAIDESLGDLLDYTREQLKKGNVFNIFRGMGSMSALYFLSVPYYVGYRIFEDTRRFAETVTLGEPTGSRRKVAHFTDTFHEINGVARNIQQMAQCARELGLEYVFVTCDGRPSVLGEKVFSPTKVYDLPEYPEMKLAFPPLLDIADFCYKENFTHIHSATPGPVGLAGLLAAKLLKREFCATYHTALPEYAAHITGDQALQDMAWTYLRWFYSQADKVFVPSMAFKEELIANGIAEEKITVMPRGIDTARFVPASGTRQDNGFKLLYVGRVSKEKNLDVLADAFKLLDRADVSLTVVGDGPHRAQLEASLHMFDATFTGYLEGDDLVRAYQESDLFVFPSTTDTFGNVILEAHACGVPTVATDSGGPQENVVDGETGLIVKGNDVYALASGIELLLDRNRLREMGRRARSMVEAKTFESAFLEFLELYDRPNLAYEMALAQRDGRQELVLEKE